MTNDATSPKKLFSLDGEEKRTVFGNVIGYHPPKDNFLSRLVKSFTLTSAGKGRLWTMREDRTYTPCLTSR